VSADRNPFFVLELVPTASPQDIERQKQKLFGMLKLGLRGAASYDTPLGTCERNPDLVRTAAASLDVPRDRLVWELWAAERGHEAPPSLAKALREHHALILSVRQTGKLSLAELSRAASTWDRAHGCAEFRRAVGKRAAILQVTDTARAIETFFEQVRQELIELIAQSAPFDLADVDSPIGQQVISDFCQRSAEMLEQATRRFAESTESQRAHLGTRWRDLRRQYRQLADQRGEYMRSLAFHSVGDELGEMALKIYQAGDYHTSEAIFLWLRSEAKAAGDDELFELHRKNARVARQALEARPMSTHNIDDVGRRGNLWLAALVCGLIFLRVCHGMASDPHLDPDISARARQEIHKQARRAVERSVNLRDAPTSPPRR
jgi:hypothetical protein